MTQYKNVTKKDFVFIIDCIKALEAKLRQGDSLGVKSWRSNSVIQC